MDLRLIVKPNGELRTWPHHLPEKPIGLAADPVWPALKAIDRANVHALLPEELRQRRPPPKRDAHEPLRPQSAHARPPFDDAGRRAALAASMLSKRLAGGEMGRKAKDWEEVVSAIGGPQPGATWRRGARPQSAPDACRSVSAVLGEDSATRPEVVPDTMPPTAAAAAVAAVPPVWEERFLQSSRENLRRAERQNLGGAHASLRPSRPTSARSRPASARPASARPSSSHANGAARWASVEEARQAALEAALVRVSTNPLSQPPSSGVQLAKQRRFARIAARSARQSMPPPTSLPSADGALIKMIPAADGARITPHQALFTVEPAHAITAPHAAQHDAQHDAQQWQSAAVGAQFPHRHVPTRRAPTYNAVLGAAPAHESAVLNAAAAAPAPAAAAVPSRGSSLTERTVNVTDRTVNVAAAAAGVAAAIQCAAAARPDTATDDDVDSGAQQMAQQMAHQMPPPPASIQFAWEHPQKLLRGLAKAEFSWGPDEQKALEQYVSPLISLDLP